MHSLDIEQIKKELFENGYSKLHIELPEEAKIALKSEAWNILDQKMANYTAAHGFLFKFLQNFHSFNSIEYIIAIRDSVNDEEGIWHDDGSRHIAFTWSLNEKPEQIDGGKLYFRKKNTESSLSFSPPTLGTFIVFLTGEYHYEHRVGQVLSGRRKTFAGWCSTI